MTLTTHPNGRPFDPPIEMTENGRHLWIRISLPGVIEEQIRLGLEKTILTLSVYRDGTKEQKSCRVPEGVRFLKKKFSDGILEITLEKPAR